MYRHSAKHNLHNFTSTADIYECFELLLAIDRQVEALDDFVRGNTGPMCKLELVNLAKELGWQLTKGNRHPDHVAYKGFSVPIPGHGKGAQLGIGIVHRVLQQLVEPKLAELWQEKQKQWNRLVTLMNDQQLATCAETFNKQQQRIRALKHDLDLANQKIQDLEIKCREANDVAEQLIIEREKYWSNRIQDLEIKCREANDAAEQLIMEQEQYWKQQAREAIQKATEEQLQNQLALEGVLLILRELEACFHQIEAFVKVLPLWVSGPLPKYLGKVRDLFERQITPLPPSKSSSLKESEGEDESDG